MTSHVLKQYEGILGQLPQFERRPAQEMMVQHVYDAIEGQYSLMVEAGPGSGKSFGYLIPALLQAKRPIVVSTGTIALQEQLIEKDIPFLAKAMGMDDLNVRLVKGRSNYLCIQKLLEMERELGNDSSGARLHMQQLRGELQDGWDGDIASLDWLVPREIWEQVASTSDDCLGRKCQYFQENPYRESREDLDRADIIVANHALYCQDVASGGALLPPHEVVIFDEAHSVKQYGLGAFTVRIGKYATLRLMQKIKRRLVPVPETYIQQLQSNEAAILHWLFDQARARTAFRLEPDIEFLEIVENQCNILDEVRRYIASVDTKQLSILSELYGESFKNDIESDRLTVKQGKLVSQLDDLIMRWKWFQEKRPLSLENRRLNWAEVDSERLYFELRSTPLNLDQILSDELWSERAAIFASATLSTNSSLDFFRSEMGLDEAQSKGLVLPTPFNYQEQCVLYLPRDGDFPADPNDPRFVEESAAIIEQLIQQSQGRAFLLFTSYGNMQGVCQRLFPKLTYPCKVQGDMPRNKLVEWFKNTPNSILFATATFWEGIDVPGDALSLVVMDKIPFVPPDDPIHAATVELMKAEGKGWFDGFVLPQAIIKLKQGFGRLIRSQDDTGVVVILDPRLRTKGYGRTIQRSLPATRVVHYLNQVPYQLFQGVPLGGPGAGSPRRAEVEIGAKGAVSIDPNPGPMF